MLKFGDKRFPTPSSSKEKERKNVVKYVFYNSEQSNSDISDAPAKHVAKQCSEESVHSAPKRAAVDMNDTAQNYTAADCQVAASLLPQTPRYSHTQHHGAKSMRSKLSKFLPIISWSNRDICGSDDCYAMEGGVSVEISPRSEKRFGVSDQSEGVKASQEADEASHSADIPPDCVASDSKVVMLDDYQITISESLETDHQDENNVVKLLFVNNESEDAGGLNVAQQPNADLLNICEQPSGGISRQMNGCTIANQLSEQDMKGNNEAFIGLEESEIVESIDSLPNKSILHLLSLEHRLLQRPLSESCQPYRVIQYPYLNHQMKSRYKRKSRSTKKGKSCPFADQIYVNTSIHGNVLNTKSATRAQTLGFKFESRDLKPFGFEEDFTSHSVDIQNLFYYAPPKNVFMRHCPESMQFRFVAMRSVSSTPSRIIARDSNQNMASGSSRSTLKRQLGSMADRSQHYHGQCILDDVSFQARSGELSVILGGSGSGKTTLLDAISARLDNRGYQQGKILIDGLHCSTSTVKSKLAYVIQHDRLLPNLTVHETLSFVAKLAYPGQDTHLLLKKVTDVLEELGLDHVKDCRVGDGLVRGISGGERRRLSIACQLIKFTHILLLDEPTTGLDTFNAYNLISTLRRLSRKNIVVIATVHQPRSELFSFFDTVTLMSEGGVVYHGPRAELIPRFTEWGYPCPDFRNPLDHYIDVVSIDRYSQDRQAVSGARVQKIIQNYRRSDLYTTMSQDLDSKKSEPVKLDHQPVVSELIYKLGLVVLRMNVNVMRSLRAFGMRSTVGLMFATMIFGFILRLKNDQSGMQNRIGLLFQIVNGPTYFGILNAIDLFPALRDLFYRESLDGLYHPSLFILAYFLHIIPFTFFTSLLFGGLAYWGVGFYPDALRCVYFTAVFFILMIQGETISIMLLGVISDPLIANGVVSLLMSVSITVGSGYVRNFQNLHPIFEIISYGSMHRYASSVLAANEFTGLNLTCSAEEYCAFQQGDDYLTQAFPTAEQDKIANTTVLACYGFALILTCHLCYSLIRIPRLR